MKRIVIPALFVALILLIGGCEKKPVVEENKHVTFHYKGTLADESVFDSSEGKEPLAFVYGVGMMIPGLEAGMKGMKTGEKKTVLVKAEDAYGPYQDEMVMPVPRKDFPSELAPEVGMQLMAQTAFGPMPVRIKEVTADTVMVDYNAPLAGKDLTFDVEIVEVRDSTEEELAPFKAAAEKTELPSGALPPIPQ
jgi:FKBP-type peptidyl-prolyl cis-trans isomerase 2